MMRGLVLPTRFGAFDGKAERRELAH